MNSELKGKLYVIGGSARSGKTIILNALVRQKPMLAFSTDALREGLRNVFVGESYLGIEKLSFSGEVTFLRAREKNSQHKQFSYHPSEDELTWQAVLGLINHYDRKNISIALEGIALTPERIKSLRLKNLEVRAIFVGFTKENHFENILAHAGKHNDWIQKAIEDNKGDQTQIKEWFNGTLEKNQLLLTKATQCGYAFFDISTEPFREIVTRAVAYLLNTENASSPRRNA